MRSRRLTRRLVAMVLVVATLVLGLAVSAGAAPPLITGVAWTDGPER